jgi:hypothetical protein
MKIKGVYYIWFGVLLILLGVYYWYSIPNEITTSALSILIGTIIWLYGDMKAGVKLFKW